MSENTAQLDEVAVEILYEKYETFPCPPLLKEDSRRGQSSSDLYPSPPGSGDRRSPLWGKTTHMREKIHSGLPATKPLTTVSNWLFSVFS